MQKSQARIKPALVYNRNADKSNGGVSLKVLPNPVKTSATIQYTLANMGKVNITIYNYLQQPVKVLANGDGAAGFHTITWDGRNTNGTNAISGLYRVVAIIDGKSYNSFAGNQ